MFFSREANWSRGESHYLDLFTTAGDALIIGESSTEYSKAPQYSGVPQRIAKFNPTARFIYIMRDPIERAISQYWHVVPRYGERRDIVTAIQHDPGYIDLSNYAMQLRPYFELFGRDNVLTLTFEELTKSPLQVIQNIFRWLGVESSFIPPNLNQKEHVTPRYVSQAKGLGLLAAFRRSTVWKQAIKPWTPPGIRLLGQRIALQDIDRTAISVEKVVEFLRPIQLPQIKTLSALLGRQFPEWTTLYGTTSTPQQGGNSASV